MPINLQPTSRDHAAVCDTAGRTRASGAYASLEALLINEIVAGNVIASTPMAACGRVVPGVACAVTRSYLLVSDGTAPDC
jgi:hypothetical protein